MTYIKKYFDVDTAVKFVNTGDAVLESITGIVLGRMPAYITDDYIIGLDTPYNGQKAIVITEACLTL